MAASGQQRYKVCTSIFDSIFDDGVTLNDYQVEEFCAENSCPELMLNLGRRMIQDCNFQDTLVNSLLQ